MSQKQLDKIKQAEQQRKNQLRLNEDFKKVYSTLEGRFVVDCILEMTGFYHSPNRDEKPEFYLGRRHVGLLIVSILDQIRRMPANKAEEVKKDE